MSLEIVAAAVVLAGLCAYAVFGGADFGAGFWMAFAFGEKRREQQEAMFNAMGPVWETNHVWLILILVMLWTAFPPVFSAVFTELYLPLTIALLGIVFRGAAFAFRHYGGHAAGSLPATGEVFSIASIVTPFAMGVCVGAVSGGRLDVANPTGQAFDAWLHPFPIVCGFIGLAITALLTPSFMLIRDVEDDVRDHFALTAFVASLFLGAVTTIAIPVAIWDAEAFARRLDEPRALVFVVAAVLLGGASLYVMRNRLYRFAPLIAAATVVAVILAWGAAMYPDIVLPGPRIEDAAAGDATLEAVLIALPLGSLVLVPSLLFLFRLFATAEPEQQV